MVENPIEIMRNAVANFVYQDGTTRGLTAWDDETTIPMASTILDASSTYYDNIGAKASAQIFASSTPRQFVSAMGEDWGAVPFFTLGEEFALKAEDPGEIDLYADEDAHIAEKLGHVREYKGMETARQPTETTLRVSRVLNRSTGSFAQTFEVADRDVTHRNHKRAPARDVPGEPVLMLGYGSTDNHTLRTTWVEIDDSWDAFATYSWGVFYKLNTAVPNTAERPFFGKIRDHNFFALVQFPGRRDG